MKKLTEIQSRKIILMIGISQSKFYDWKNRYGEVNNHNGAKEKRHWILNSEREAIIKFAKQHPGEGYRRLTYMMIDSDIAAVSPSTTYRVLKKAGLLNKWNQVKSSSKGHGFNQPKKVHQQWHTDIKYVYYKGTYLFLISVIDGFSRYIVHHELRTSMTVYDVKITIQRAIEKFPNNSPQIISDNGSQYISKDFALYIKLAGLKHIRTSIAYPQANGKIERFHRSLSEEHLRRSSFINIDDARRQISKYISFYNNERLHSSLFYLTPQETLLGKTDERLLERQNKLDIARKRRSEANRAA